MRPRNDGTLLVGHGDCVRGGDSEREFHAPYEVYADLGLGEYLERVLSRGVARAAVAHRDCIGAEALASLP